jgi:hypothetical protein
VKNFMVEVADSVVHREEELDESLNACQGRTMVYSKAGESNN